MKRSRILICLLLLPLALNASVDQAQGASPGWQPLASGIEYREFYLPFPDHLYVTRMDRSNPQVILESGIGQGRMSGGAETVRAIAARYDGAINYWGEDWGARNRVVAAINGYFFDTETGIPYRGQVTSGWYAKRFDNYQSGSGFAWNLGRQAFIGGCVTHPSAKQLLNFLDHSQEISFDGINTPREQDDLIIYTPQFDAQTGTPDEGVEVLVELSRPLMIIPAPAMITGTIRVVRVGLGNSAIPFDHIVLSASGVKADRLSSVAVAGERVGISQELRHYQSNCQTPLEVGWDKTYASVGTSFEFLRDGVILGYDDIGSLVRSPRTAIAFNERYIYFIVVDGRDQFKSVGMSMVELAVFAKTRLGAVWGAALDGGGSSTMVVGGEVKNSPSTLLEDGSAIGVMERSVGNSLMMVVVQPKEQSTNFRAGVTVRSLQELQVRLGPGTNYAAMAVVLANTDGVIMEHANRMNGVFAKGSYWWKVAFGDVAGWVAEEMLERIDAP